MSKPEDPEFSEEPDIKMIKVAGGYLMITKQHIPDDVVSLYYLIAQLLIEQGEIDHDWTINHDHDQAEARADQ